MKGLIASIYKNSYGDCSNGGISSRVEKVTLVGPGIPEIFEADEKHPAVWLRKRGDRIHAIPEEPGKETVWWMFGGCFIYTSDSRFPGHVPIALHDRTEDERTYKRLSA